MKNIKILLSIVLLITMFTFTGCSSNDNTSFDYGTALTDTGFFEDITALDYVTLPDDYEGITIPSDIHEISDETVQSEIDYLLTNYSEEVEITDRAVEDGDTVNIDYVGTVDGVEFDGGSTDGVGTSVTIGVTNYIDDFLEQLIGHTPGESFDIEVTFPEDYGVEELNGKDAVFSTTINYITEYITPEFTDEFVSENFSEYYGWNTVDEMTEVIKSDLQTSSIENYIYDYIISNSTISSLPDSILEYQRNLFVDYYESTALQYGMELDDFLNTYMMVESVDDLLEYYSEDITASANYCLIIQAIAESANISINEDSLTAYFSEYLGLDDYSELEEHYGLPYLNFTVLQVTVFDYLIDNAILK